MLPSREWIHIPPWEKENHLQNAIFGGYVSSLEGTIFFENPTTLKFVIQIVVSTKYFQFILCLVRDVYISGDVVTLIWMHIKSLSVYEKTCHSKWLHCSPTPYAYSVCSSLVDVIFTPRDLHQKPIPWLMLFVVIFHACVQDANGIEDEI